MNVVPIGTSITKTNFSTNLKAQISFSGKYEKLAEVRKQLDQLGRRWDYSEGLETLKRRVADAEFSHYQQEKADKAERDLLDFWDFSTTGIN